jgi:hypothetical protein
MVPLGGFGGGVEFGGDDVVRLIARFALSSAKREAILLWMNFLHQDAVSSPCSSSSCGLHAGL